MLKDNKKVQELFKRAKNHPNKGRMYVYEEFKNELRELNLDYKEFEQASIEIARLLHV